MPHPFQGRFPDTRLRRSRGTAWSRALFAESTLRVEDLIWGVFLKEGDEGPTRIENMPGVFRLSIAQAVTEIKKLRDLGICAVAIFPHIPMDQRSADAALALDAQNLMCRAARAIKAAVPDIGLIGDVALDPYTDHGHDGLMRGDEILNDETVNILCQQAIIQAAAGFDIVAPSDMMDGRVGAIRHALDAEGYHNTQIMAYAAKYASCFYGPFRGAIGSDAALKGDKKTYQLPPSNWREGLREVELDIAEGADSVIVKPGLPYLDMVSRVKDQFGMPVIAYQVSGEYAMLAAAHEAGALDFDAAMAECLIAFKRAGADAILTYYADRMAKILKSTR